MPVRAGERRDLTVMRVLKVLFWPRNTSSSLFMRSMITRTPRLSLSSGGFTPREYWAFTTAETDREAAMTP